MEQLLLERKRKLSMANVKRKYESQAKKDRRLGLILMIPIILVVFGIMGYPFCRALYLSFTNKVEEARHISNGKSVRSFLP